jgi:hypothetical protein
LTDPTITDPDKYRVVFENERVRVLEYRDEPGQKTSPHEHPDSIMYTLSGFERRLIAGSGESRDVTLPVHQARCGGSTPRFTAARTSVTRRHTSSSWS